MNAKQRKQLDEIYSKLEGLQSDIETIRDDEQDKLSNMEEKFSGTERYSTLETQVEYLNSAFDSLTEVLESIDNARSES